MSDQVRTEKKEIEAFGSSEERSAAKSWSNNDAPRLPWWVELLFVQIGLPDNWLRIFLKKKKQTIITIQSNKKAIGQYFFILIIMAYFYPITRQARIHNSCVQNSNEYVVRKLTPGTISDEKGLKAWTHRFCNGGNIKL